MIRIHVRHADGSLHEEERTTDPVEAEAHYLRLVQTRTDHPASVILHVPRGQDLIVEPAQYRIDRGWPAEVAREHVLERQRQLWAPADRWEGPTAFQLRGLVLAAGVSGAELARRIGVEPRTWRRWLSDPDSDGAGKRIPYATWVAVLRLSGLLPEGEHAAPVTRAG